MDVTRKDATVTNTAPVDEFPGSFRVVLSAPTKDRDGDTLLAEEWKQPLPDHITFDLDHEMSVRGTIGSGKPWIDWNNEVGAGKGAMIVDGTYSSLSQAQDARTLVNEGHIKTTSVAFMTEKTQKDGKQTVVRELLNGALVAVPSNREAVILSSKGAKSGARNSKADQFHLDEIARHAAALGANFHSADDPQGGDSDGNPDVAASKTYSDVLFRLFSRDVDATKTLSATAKDADTEDASSPAALIAATDAAIDSAIDLLSSVDATTLPPAVRQAIALIQAADSAVDELMDALGIPDPDEDADTGAAAPTPATGAPAPAAGAAKAAPVEDHSIDPLVAARQRFYATLTGRN